MLMKVFGNGQNGENINQEHENTNESFWNKKHKLFPHSWPILVFIIFHIFNTYNYSTRVSKQKYDNCWLRSLHASRCLYQNGWSTLWKALKFIRYWDFFLLVLYPSRLPQWVWTWNMIVSDCHLCKNKIFENCAKIKYFTQVLYHFFILSLSEV